MRKILALLVPFAAVIGVSLFSIGQAAWGTNCSYIAWDSQQPTCDDDPTSTSDTFSFSLGTTTWSDLNPGTFDYTLCLVFVAGNSPNIDSGSASVTPDSHSVSQTNTYYSVCAGELANPSNDGTFHVAAYDSPGGYCSGEWDVDIIKHPNSCP